MRVRVIPHSGHVFWEGGLLVGGPTLPRLTRADLPYTRAGKAYDLHGYSSAESALAAWAAAAVRHFSDRAEALRVISGARRRVYCAAVVHAPLVSAFDPVLLRQACVGRQELLAGEWHARWRVASAARHMPGVHGLLIPPTVPGGLRVVLFAGFISEHLEILTSAPQGVTISELPRRRTRVPAREGVVVALRASGEAAGEAESPIDPTIRVGRRA
jgi:hypothetical protein